MWNIKKEKDRENENVGDRRSKLDEKKSYSEIKKTKETNFVGRTISTFCSGGEKMRNASGQAR